MSTKPASLPRWAGVSGAITVPSSGVQDLGWVSGASAQAEYANWLADLAYQWLKWLDDGDVDFAALTSNSLVVDTSIGCATVVASGLVTAANYDTAGYYKHSTAYPRYIPASAAAIPVTPTLLDASGASIVLDTSTTPCIYPVPCTRFETITGWRLYWTFASAGIGATARLYRYDSATTTETAIGAARVGADDAGGFVTVTGLTENVSAESYQYYIRVFGCGSTGDIIRHALVYVTHV